MRNAEALTRLRSRQIAILFAMAFSLAELVVPPFHRPLFVYNASASLPLGFYWAQAVGQVRRDDLLLVRLPDSARELATARNYLPTNVPIIKQVAALTGDQVCVASNYVVINGKIVAAILLRDHSGRMLPSWEGCRSLIGDEFFLLSPAEASFDSRYFGPIRRADICAKLVPLWIW